MKILLSLIMIFSVFNSFAQTWDQYIYRGKQERAKGNFEKAGFFIAKGAELKGTNNFEHYYYAAIMYANANNLDSSFKLLSKCIDAGMFDWARWERNSRLKLLRDDKRWTEMHDKMVKAEQEYSRALSKPSLREALKKMWKRDQDLVGKWDQQKVVVDQNTLRLNRIIDQYGWPTRSMVGKDGSWMAWAIAQHSQDIHFQRKCLKLLEKTLATNEPEPVLYAELYDRICRNTNHKQKFGQAIIEKNGVKKFYPIENKPGVDARRASIGLVPLQVYANENHVEYKSEKSSRM